MAVPSLDTLPLQAVPDGLGAEAELLTDALAAPAVRIQPDCFDKLIFGRSARPSRHAGTLQDPVHGRGSDIELQGQVLASSTSLVASCQLRLLVEAEASLLLSRTSRWGSDWTRVTSGDLRFSDLVVQPEVPRELTS
jgi:hypothetical protein